MIKFKPTHVMHLVSAFTMVARASQKQAVDKMASTYDRLKRVWTLDTESAERFSKIQNLCELVIV